MAYKGLMDDVKRAIALERPQRVPVFACGEEFDVHWYGKWDYETVCQDGDKIAEVWSATIREFDYDWAWVQVDDCFEFEPLGIDCPGEGDILRATVTHLPATRETLKSLPVIDPRRDGRIPEKLKALSRLRDEFGDTVLVEGAVAAPYSCVGLSCGISEAMMLAVEDPGLLADFCSFFTEQQYNFARPRSRPAPTPSGWGTATRSPECCPWRSTANGRSPPAAKWCSGARRTST